MTTFTGTAGSDSIVGTSGDDIINATTPPGGGTSLYGGDGADVITALPRQDLSPSHNRGIDWSGGRQAMSDVTPIDSSAAARPSKGAGCASHDRLSLSQPVIRKGRLVISDGSTVHLRYGCQERFFENVRLSLGWGRDAAGGRFRSRRPTATPAFGQVHKGPAGGERQDHGCMGHGELQQRDRNTITPAITGN